MKTYSRMLFEKIYRCSRHCDEKEYIDSVLQEIGVVLSCRIRSDTPTPYDFGIPDIQMLNGGGDDTKNEFMNAVRKIVMEHDKRITDMQVTDLKIDDRTQNVTIKIMLNIIDIDYTINGEFCIR